jgi:tRNA(Ile)-lysidine synthase TilS/MesJ
MIWDRIKAQGESPILKRFLMATYKKYSMKVHGAKRSIENFMFCTDLFAECTEPRINQSIESKESYQDLFKVVEKEYLTFAANQKEITLSLSGGVDSMVLFHILHLLRKQYNFKLNIVHINYNNRLICSREEKFVCCAAAKHGYTVFVRVFDEIKRSECIQVGLREFYERYTESGRFQAYLDVGQGVPFVALGHNMCDCVENIFTNISNNCGFDNLKGMTVMSEKVFTNSNISVSQAINIFRPLLTVSKDSIRYYASVNNISHLQNSTPVWSQRGKLRNNVISVIEKWDKRFIPNLIKLATQNSEIYKFVNMRASQIYTNHFVNKQPLSLSDIQNTPVYVWSEIFRHFLNIQVSKKSIEHFMGKAIKSDFKVVLTPVVTLAYSKGLLTTK